MRSAPASSRKNVALFALTAAVSIGLVFMGIYHDEMGEVLFNASMLCLSCIGMG